MPLNDELVSQMSEEMQQYFLLKKLVDGIFNNVGIEKLMVIIEETLMRPVMFLDMGFHIVAESPQVAQRSELHEYKMDNVLLKYSYTHLICSHYLYSKMRERDYTSAFIETENDAFLVASVKSSFADVLILLVFQENKEFDNMDLRLIKKICHIMSVEFQKENSFNYYRIAMPNHMIISMLEGEQLKEQDYIDKLPHLSWIKEGCFYMMFIKDENAVDLGMRISTLINALRLYIPTDNCIMYKTGMIAFLTKEIYEKICFQITDEFKEFLKYNHLHAAIGPEYHQLSSSRSQYQIVLKLMEVMEKFNDVLAVFQDMRYHIIADFIDKNYDIRYFCHPSIQQLISFDEENHTELLHTLECYLECKNDINTVVEKLYIHRSTLFYRLKKIKEITGLNLEASEEVFDLYFSLKLMRIYGKNFFLQWEEDI